MSVFLYVIYNNCVGRVHILKMKFSNMYFGANGYQTEIIPGCSIYLVLNKMGLVDLNTTRGLNLSTLYIYIYLERLKLTSELWS